MHFLIFPFLLKASRVEISQVFVPGIVYTLCMQNMYYKQVIGLVESTCPITMMMSQTQVDKWTFLSLT